MYIYGGYILTGGKLDNGKPWEGINILFAEVESAEDLPLSGMIGKARRDEELLKQLMSMPIGCPCEVSCDLRGKVTSISTSKPDPDIVYAT